MLTSTSLQSDKAKAGAIPDEKATDLGARDRASGSYGLSFLLTSQIVLVGKQRKPTEELNNTFSGG